jgi:hypothetical protein
MANIEPSKDFLTNAQSSCYPYRTNLSRPVVDFTTEASGRAYSSQSLQLGWVLGYQPAHCQ